MSFNQYTNLNLNGHLALDLFKNISTSGSTINDLDTLDTSYLRFTGSNITLTGLNPQYSKSNNKLLTILYAGSGTLIVSHANILSTDGYRINCPSSENITLSQNDSMNLIYDNTTSVWYVLSVSSNTNGFTNEPTGFPVDSNGQVDRTSSSITFSTRTFSISPSGTSYNILIKGQVYNKTSTESITIPNITGSYYVYFDTNGSLTYSDTFSLDIILKYVYVAILYYNATSSSLIIFGDERHGCTMDGHTHARIHAESGAVYVSGSALSGFTIDGNGTSNTHTQFAIDSGQVRDEDILHNLSSKLSTDSIPVLYRLGTQDWYSVTNTNQKFHYVSGGRAYWNQNTSGTYSLTEITNDDFVLYHIVSTNDKNNPYFSIMGLNRYTTKNNAREGALNEISQYTGLPFTEFVFIATIIFESKNSFTNTGKSIIVSTDTGATYIDWRFNKTLNPSTVNVNIHNNLGGLQGGGSGNYYHSNQLINTDSNVNFNSITSPTINSSSIINANNIIATGTTNLNNINVTGITNLSTTNISGTSNLSNTNVTGTLNTTNTNVSQNLNVTGTSTLSTTNMNSGNITNNLNVTGTSNLTNLNVSQNLNVTGTTTLNISNSVNSNISGNLNVTGTTTVSTINSSTSNTTGNLNVTGTINSTNINISNNGNINNLSATGITTNSLQVSNITYPTEDGTSGQALVTNGTGTLSFQTVSGGGGSSSVSTTFTSTSVYPIGSPMYYGASGWNLAIATSDITSVQYVISSISGSGTFTYTASSIGEITLTTNEWDVITDDSGGLASGTTYFLSSNIAGKIRTSPGLLYAPVLRAISSTKAFISLSINNTESGMGDTFYRETTTTVANTSSITLSYPPAGKAYVWLSIDGVIQSGNDFSLSGNTLTLGATIPSNTLIDVLYARAVLLSDSGAINKMVAFSEIVSGSAKTTFNLPSVPSGLGSCIVFVGGAIQDTSKFNLSGNVLTMMDSVPIGVQLVAYILNSSGITNSIDAFVVRQTYSLPTSGTVNISTIFGSQVSGLYRFFDINDPRISGTILVKHNGVGSEPDLRIDSNSSTISITINTASKLNIYIASNLLTFQNNTSNTISLRIYREI